ncbi:MAG: hypothetical protein LUO93_02270 [Methanomicrobiales archaeon]|nr:hypothetical protein [Methanomicrobiales archaeon]
MPVISEHEVQNAEEEGSAKGVVRAPCGIFPVKSGVPVIGLGLLLILVAAMSLFLGFGAGTLPALVLFGGFGIFLIWLGFTK